MLVFIYLFNAYFFRLPYAPNSEICAQNCFFPVLMSHICSLFFALCARYMLVSSVMIDVCLVSYNVHQVCDLKNDMHTDLQTTIIGLMGICDTLCCP